MTWLVCTTFVMGENVGNRRLNDAAVAVYHKINGKKGIEFRLQSFRIETNFIHLSSTIPCDKDH